ncbi:RNA polymerase sigma factor [Chloroflexi bacterium TSY]|nr:RNA polymerase sigma factor [Chloroflexi bacterium TSY]
MTTTTQIDQLHFQELLMTQRPRLLGLCTYLTSDPSSAEDIVQEVMLEAWCSLEKLRNPEALDAWLNGIVRNVCARWQRIQGRESVVMLPEGQDRADTDAVLDTVADDFDLEVELDRQEMADLLDRAMALLPETTRDVLISKYIAESRHAEIANQLGLKEHAVTMRLKRGKVALRKLLTTELRTEAEAFGLVTSVDEWSETRLWCSLCGQRRLQGKLTATIFALRCPNCTIEPNAYLTGEDWAGTESPFGLLKSFRPVLKRHAIHSYERWTTTLEKGEYICPHCAKPTQLHLRLPANLPSSMRRFRGMSVTCHHCNNTGSMALPGMAIYSPEGRDFLKAHPRVHMLPEREIEYNGAAAIVQSFASLTDSSTFDVIFHRETYNILASHQNDVE